MSTDDMIVQAQSLHARICTLEEENRAMSNRIEDNEREIRELVKDYKMYSDTITMKLALKFQDMMKDDPQFKSKIGNIRFWYTWAKNMRDQM